MIKDFLNVFFKPDSVFATERLAKGEIEVIPSLLKNSIKRALFMIPGIYVVGVRGRQLVGASILGSIGVSLSLVGYFLMNPNYETDLCGD